MFRGEKVPADGQWHELALPIPAGQEGYIQEVGVILCGTSSGFGQGDLCAYLDDLYVDGAPDYCLDFSRMEMNCWTGLHQDVPQFGRLKGHTYLDGPWLSLSCADFGEMYTGHHLWEDYSLSCTLRPVTGEVHLLQARVQGATAQLCRRLLWLGKSSPSEEPERLSGGGRGQLPLGKEYRLTLSVKGNTVTLGGGWEQASGVGGPPAPGAWMRGCAVQRGTTACTKDWKIRSCEEL